MALSNTIQAAEQYLKAAWQAIDDRSGVLPAELNMKNLSEAILSIHGGVGDLGKFQRDLRLDYAAAQEKYPVGTEFEDEWDGTSAPLIIVNYQKVQATDGELKDGVILQRRYPTEKVFVSGSTYPTGFNELSAYLNSEYYEKSSEMVKSVAQEVTVPIDIFISNAVGGHINGKWFAPTSANVCFVSGQTETTNVNFAYWLNLTGGHIGIMDAAGRIVKTQEGAAVTIELYSYSSTTDRYTYFISTRGGQTVAGVSPRTLPCIAIY